ncbi:hypothetical protein ACFQE1_21290, partial [Halobium palmae]
MGRKITLFRFDVELGDDGGGEGEHPGDEHVTVERTEGFDAVADDDEDEAGGSLVRKLLVAGALL